MMFLRFRSSGWVMILLTTLGILIGVFLYVYRIHYENFATVPFNENKEIAPNESLPSDATVISPQGVHISVRRVDTDTERMAGLSRFKSLPDKEGMLFIFPQMGIYPFWMKDMNFPLDIIWIDDFGKIIYRAIHVEPASYPEIITPSGLARYVLEIPANTADRDGFLVGATVLLPNNK